MLVKVIVATTIAFTVIEAHGDSNSTLPEGKSEKLKTEFIQSEDRPFEYKPIDPVFWAEVEKAKDKESPEALARLAARQIKKFGEETEEGQEALVALAQSLASAHLYNAAFVICEQIAVEKNGTNIGAKCLEIISVADTLNKIDKVRLENFMNSNEFAGLHSDIQSFVSFYKYLYNKKFGFSRWAELNLQKIKKDSYWRVKLIYLEALSQVVNGKMVRAQKVLQSIVELESAPSDIVTRAKIQLARIWFEDGKFEDAYNMYTSVTNTTNREKGRLELERAWTQYYLKNYSKALGILTALKSPFYAKSMSAERFVLEMIIYKELCYYGEVERTAQSFRSTFGETLSRIRQRKKLRYDPNLFAMAIVDRPLELQANSVHLIRLEGIKLKEMEIEYEGVEQVIAKLKNMEKLIRMRLDYLLEERVRDVAQELLDVEEQISFVEYISRLDALKLLEERAGRVYEPEVISKLRFEKIYWPWTGEFWLDEVNNYTTLISSRCSIKEASEEKFE